MVIDYVSSAMDEQDFDELFKDSPKMPGQQAQKYNRLMIQGLAANVVNVHAVSGRPVTPSNYSGKYLPKKLHKDGRVTWRYGSVSNVPVVKNLWQMMDTYSCVKHESKKKGNAVILDVLNASVAYGASEAAKKAHRPCIGIVTDLPELMVTGSNQRQVSLIHKVMDNCTGFVFLTEAMNDAANPEHKPYVIVEALCDINMKTAERKKNSGIKKCMYAGLLDARYGVKAMVDGFVLADVPDTELHVYGNGPYVDELKKVVQNHSNVIYHGTVMNEVIVREELEASLLINPRPTREEFTKYSFPSKNMEYMVSGTPVMTTRLPGMPRDYYPYVYLIEDEDTQGIAECFRKVLSLSDEELDQKGESAKQFVLDEKNNVVQAEKVIGLIKSMLSKGIAQGV